ncbi:MAG: hypothetical protein E4H17_02525 [Gemmatimonadales bacterium]|nr:MAG: hypothetical protein E4H17_02525 [Gemmatimonadales bacterium]
MNIQSITRRARGIAPALVLILIACDAANIIGPENQLEVGNVADTFQWQVTALDQVSQPLTYTWTTTGSVINVNQSSSSVGGGSATLSVVDASGSQVYLSSLVDDSGTFQTSQGAPGTWTITVTLSEVTGGLNFRLEKP